MKNVETAPGLTLGPIKHLMHHARKTPAALALVGPNLELSFQDLLTEVQRIANWLRGSGVKSGDMVLLDLSDEYERVYTLACIHEGVVSAGLPKQGDFSKLASHGFTHLVSLSQDAGDSGIAVLTPTASETRAYLDLPSGFEPAVLVGDDVVRVIYSSGTTGHPKAVAFTKELLDKRIAAALEHYMRRRPYLTLVGFRTVAGNSSFFLDLWLGETSIVSGEAGFNLKMIHRFGTSGIMGSPSSLEALSRKLDADTAPSTVSEVTSAGGFLSADLAKRLETLLGSQVTNVYGSTEAGQVARTDAGGDSPNKLEPYPGVVLVIEDDSGQPVPAGVTGKLRISVDYLAAGYLGDQADSGQFANGNFYPGDLAALDGQGKLELKGRADDLLNLNGHKINPIPLEDFAQTELGLTEAASVLARDQDGKSYHVMFVVSSGTVDTKAVQKRLFQEFGTLGPQLVVQAKQLPKNEMGKLIRHSLMKRQSDS